MKFLTFTRSCSLAFTYCFTHRHYLATAWIPPKNSCRLQQLSKHTLFVLITGVISTQPMVKPTKHTFRARLIGINDNVVEAAVYGALNLKPENPRQRVKDYTLQTFWYYSCNVAKECWRGKL